MLLVPIQYRCSDYVQHLVRVNKEKEEAVQKARNDLQAKQLRKMEDEKIAQQDPSEPESTTTTSSLTVSSDSAANAEGCGGDVGDSQSVKGSDTDAAVAADIATPGDASKVVSDDKDSSSSSSSGGDGSSKHRKRSGTTVVFSIDNAQDEDINSCKGAQETEPLKKKARLTSHQSSLSSSGTTSGDCGDAGKSEDGGGCNSSGSKDRAEGNSHGGQSLSTNVSDITDSQKGSSTSTSCKEYSSFSSSDPQSGNGTTGSDKTKRASSAASYSDSVSSDAAVAPRGVDRSESGTGKVHHADVIIKERSRSSSKRKNSPSQQADPEATSLDTCFELDYEEVFLKSNVPQILATPSGRIVAHNEFFLRATGLSPKEVDRLTIFSLVQRAKLSNLFELVAAALRDTNEETTNASNENRERQEQQQPSSSEGESEDGVRDASTGDPSEKTLEGPLQNYAAMTLPCVNFHGSSSSSSDDDADDEDDGDDDVANDWNDRSKKDKQKRSPQNRSRKNIRMGPLFMTVTLMADEDVRKRCFHCMFTDCPGTDGALGSITPELLAMLFPGNVGQKQHQRGSNKKMRVSQ